MTDSMTDRQILGSKFWALGAYIKIEENSSVECHMENWRPKMAPFHRETKKKNRFERAAWQRDSV